MRTAILTRDKSLSGPDGLFGCWTSDSGFKCMTAERPEGSAIHPPIEPWFGLVKLVQSPRFYKMGVDYGFGRGMVYQLQGVPGRDGIEIHSANWPEIIVTIHEAQHYQLEGCIAPGAAVAKIQVPAPDGRILRGVTSSVDAVKALMRDMGGEAFMLTIC